MNREDMAKVLGFLYLEYRKPAKRLLHPFLWRKITKTAENIGLSREQLKEIAESAIEYVTTVEARFPASYGLAPPIEGKLDLYRVKIGKEEYLGRNIKE